MAARQLATFLSEAAGRGFIWGRHDCMLFAADWARALTGEDPAAAWRGTYGTQAGALAVLSNEGGAVAIMAQGLEPFGWRRRETSDLRPGDILLAHPPHHSRAAGVAVDSARVALLSRRGVVICATPIVAAWRLC